MSTRPDRTIVLLGAGASADAGLPVTSTLARKIVERANRQQPLRFPPENREWVSALNVVYGAMVGHHSGNGENPLSAVNIETLISAIRLLQHREDHEVAPFVATWISSLNNIQSAEIPSGFGEKIGNSIAEGIGRGHLPDREITDAVAAIAQQVISPDITEPLQRAENYIFTALVELLNDINDVDYLQPLIDLAKNQSGGLDILTLNYDLTIEKIAQKNGMPFHRGIDSWRPGQPLEFTESDSSLNLIKLHGSLDWTLNTTSPELVKILTPPSISICDLTDFPNDSSSVKPWIVLGDRGKLETEGPTLVLNSAARKRLLRANHLVIIGYSFSDSHVNALIRDWLALNAENTVTIVDRQFQRNHYYYTYGVEKDFLTEMLHYYGRDTDHSDARVKPRILTIEGAAKNVLEKALSWKIEVPPEHLLSIFANKQADGKYLLTLTWSGADITNTIVSAAVVNDSRRYHGPESSLLLSQLEKEQVTRVSAQSDDFLSQNDVSIGTILPNKPFELLLQAEPGVDVKVTIHGNVVTGSDHTSAFFTTPEL